MTSRCNQCFYKKIAEEEDEWCYMFRDFMRGCKQFTGENAVTKEHSVSVSPTVLGTILLVLANDQPT